MTTVRVECGCGQVSGAATGLSPKMGNRAVCYCRDCRAYAHYLGADGILDAHGGSDIFQMTPSHLVIDTGAKHLACVRLTQKGLFRWYASCCRTPVGNTIGWSRLPFVGVVQPFMRHSVEATRDDVLGPVRVHSSPESAANGAPPSIRKPGPSDLVHLTRVLGGGALRGEHQPSPFFGRDGNPIVTPHVLSPEERASLYPTPRR